MKRFKSLSLKKKRNLAIAGVSLVVLAVGGVIAYNQTATIFNNKFQLGTDNITAIDIVPIDRETAQPCSVYDKTATVTNNNTTPRYVRMKINEYWRTKDSTQTDHKTTDLPMTWDDNGTTRKYATWNADPQAEDKWSLESDGYYYYYQPLAPNATTESLIMNVSFDCHANFAGEMTYSQDGQIAGDTPSPYADSTFHVYVIFETSDEEFAVAKTRLYDLVASKTNGIDSGVNFADYSTISEDNGNGVNTLAAHANDEHPVYYYRGEINDNNVLFNNYCWKILRTTGTGGTKLIYSGAPTEENGIPVCNNTGTDVQLEGKIAYYRTGSLDDIYMGNCYYSNASLGVIGYMYNTRYNVRCEDYGDMYELTVGNDVRYENGQYTLIDTVTGGVGPISSNIFQSKHYYCAEGGTSCEKVRYIYAMSSYQVSPGWKFHVRAVEFTNGGKIDDENGVYANDYDSEAKTTVENWFENSGMVSIEDKLEDTIYCNDRTTYNQLLDSKDANIMTSTIDDFYFNAGHRNTRLYKPSVDCAKKRDSFTKEDTVNGNGKLRHKTGLITSDELTLSGMVYCKSPTDKRLFLQAEGMDSWTMTPENYNLSASINYQFYWNHCHSATNSINYIAAGVRPVISMKYDTYVKDGDGTGDSPYTLEW